MSTARKLIEQGHGPDDVRGKDYLKQMSDPRVVKMEVIMRFSEPFDEMDMRNLVADVSEALLQHANNVGFSPQENSVVECTVNPIQPARGTPAGWDLLG